MGWFKNCCTPVFSEVVAPRAMALTVALAGAAQLAASIWGVGLPCGFHSVTGLPCPGCGLTRSVLALLQGHAKESVLLHPFGPVLLLGLVIALVAGILPQGRRQRLVGAMAAVESRTGVMMWLLMLLMILWGVRITGVLTLAPI